MTRKLISIIILGLVIPGAVFSHSGRTNGSGCHNCRTGSCAGTYHCHNGLSSSSSSSYGASSYTPPTVTCPANSYKEGSSCICNSGFCPLGNTCYATPSNASCAVGDSSNARKCDSGYEERGSSCYRLQEEVIAPPPTEKIQPISISVDNSTSNIKSENNSSSSNDSGGGRIWVLLIGGAIGYFIKSKKE